MSLTCITYFFDGRDFAEHLSDRSWSASENAQNSLNHIVYLDQSLPHDTHSFSHCPATDMQYGDDASPSIISAGQELYAQMLITLELLGIL